IGDGKKAGMVVMLRQLILFIPAILLFPKFFGATAVWWAEPVVDFSMIMLGLFLMLNGLRKMGKQQITNSFR
ncbi:MAG: MATE family efflux transporter, partial [Treponemataceae bacterium]